MKKTYLTTPIYYVNDVPHIGHAYTTIAADIFARWETLNGRPVFFLTGTDEHGAKIEVAAEKNGETPQAYTDRISGEFRRLWGVLNIEPSDYIRTTEPRHKKTVQAVFEKLKSTGDIYKGVYEDWYCLNDESYFSESELVNKACPTCGRAVQKLKEESYFFRLSKYQQPLLDHYQKNPGFLAPKNRALEITNFVSSGLKDLSVSRTRVKWGIPVLSDPDHVVYVWFDALLNYISVLGFDPASGGFEKKDIWPADLHLVGKEIFRFHTVIWPAMLMALNVPLPARVYAHGWWTVEGTKMSKSLGNVVDPHKMVAAYGVDVFRYFLFRDVPFGSDGDFSEKALVARANAELSNNLGNLLQRTLTILAKQFDGVIPSVPQGPSVVASDPKGFIANVDRLFAELDYQAALQCVVDLLVKTNQYIDEKAPWKLGPDQKALIGQILVECLTVLKIVAPVLWPFMPEKASLLWSRLGETTPLAQAGPRLLDGFRKGEIPRFSDGQKTDKGEPLFPRFVMNPKPA